MLTIPLTDIALSKTNPRRRRDEKADAELVESVRRHGVLQPVLVRPAAINGKAYELVAGSRRFTAAKAAGLDEIPAIEKQLTDVEALEVQVIENLQRADVHPLEEAEGYRQLSSKPGYDVATVAERVGRSAKYVYDRMKLLALTKEAKQLFLDDRITAGHAILLARLKPADQARAIEARDGLFQDEHTLWDPEDSGARNGSKPRSVRELQGWIDSNVRFDAREPDPMLFPETAEEIARAQKVVPITFSHYIPPEARDGKTFGPRSWKRADGQRKSKTCELSTTGVVMVGPHRGEAFAVCVAKEKCAVHWGAEIRARKQRASAQTAAGGGSPAKKAESPEAAQRREALDRALRVAHEAAREEIDQAVGEAAAKVAPEVFVRRLALTRQNDIGPVLKDADATLKTGADVDRWLRKAPIAEVQRALAVAELEYSDDDWAEALEIDTKAIYTRHERLAREALRLQTSAKSGQSPAKPKPRGRKAGAK